MRIGQFVEYKGYVGSIEYDPHDKIHYGSLLNIEDCIGYHAKTFEELSQRYQEAIDRYIEVKDMFSREDGHKIVL